jgi:uncharacterized protein YukE
MPWTRYTAADRERIATSYDQSADRAQAVADRLTGEGHDTAAGIHGRSAQGHRQIADAAREGSDALNEILLG